MLKQTRLEYLIKSGTWRGFVCLEELLALIGDPSDNSLLDQAYTLLNNAGIPVVDKVDESCHEIFISDIDFNIKLFNHINRLVEVGRKVGYIIESTILTDILHQDVSEEQANLIYSVLEEEGIPVREHILDKEHAVIKQEASEDVPKQLSSEQLRRLLYNSLMRIYNALYENHEAAHILPRIHKRMRGIIQTTSDFLEGTSINVLFTKRNKPLIKYYRQIEEIVMEDMDQEQVVESCLNILGMLEVFLPVYEEMYGKP